MTARITQLLATTAAVALLGVATLFPSPVAAQDLALADAVILNPADESVRRGVLLIEAGRISDVVTHIPPEFAGRILDVEGRFVVPALADLHIHSWGHASPGGTPQLLGPEGAARAALYNGVAFILDLFSPEQMILEFRDRQRDEGAQGAVLLAAGPCFTATNGHCSQFGTPTRIVDTPDEARHEVADLAASAPDVVKIVYDHQVYGDFSLPTIDLPTLGALIETAREHGLKTVVHVGTWQDMREAAASGADAVTHTPGPAAIPSDLAEELAQAGTLPHSHACVAWRSGASGGRLRFSRRPAPRRNHIQRSARSVPGRGWMAPVGFRTGDTAAYTPAAESRSGSRAGPCRRSHAHRDRRGQHWRFPRLLGTPGTPASDRGRAVGMVGASERNDQRRPLPGSRLGRSTRGRGDAVGSRCLSH